jgi:flavin-binding protein dodecin
MTDSVYKTIEITGTSTEGITQAIENAVSKASSTLHNLGWFEVTTVRGHVVDEKVDQYQVTLKIGFRLD